MQGSAESRAEGDVAQGVGHVIVRLLLRLGQSNDRLYHGRPHSTLHRPHSGPDTGASQRPGCSAKHGQDASLAYHRYKGGCHVDGVEQRNAQFRGEAQGRIDARRGFPCGLPCQFRLFALHDHIQHVPAVTGPRRDLAFQTVGVDDACLFFRGQDSHGLALMADDGRTVLVQLHVRSRGLRGQDRHFSQTPQGHRGQAFPGIPGGGLQIIAKTRPQPLGLVRLVKPGGTRFPLREKRHDYSSSQARCQS